MIWIYLIAQAVGLEIIALCFKAEDKDGCAAAFRMSGLFSLLLVVLAAPIPVKVLTGLLIMLFRSRINLAVTSGRATLLNFCRVSSPALSALASTASNLVSRLTPKRLNPFLDHAVFQQQEEQETAEVNHPNSTINNIIIDIEAVEVTHWF